MQNIFFFENKNPQKQRKSANKRAIKCFGLEGTMKKSVTPFFFQKGKYT
jgi:hypothetical protein